MSETGHYSLSDLRAANKETVSFDDVKNYLGMHFIVSLAPATGLQLHGNDSEELYNTLIVPLQENFAQTGGTFAHQIRSQMSQAGLGAQILGSNTSNAQQKAAQARAAATQQQQGLSLPAGAGAGAAGALVGALGGNALQAQQQQAANAIQASYDQEFIKALGLVIDGALGRTAPLFMNKVNYSVCRIPTFKKHTKVLTPQIYQDNLSLRMVAPPCFRLDNEFEVGEKVLILPETYIVNSIMCPRHKPKNHVIYTYYTDSEGKHPLFVLCLEFEITERISTLGPGYKHGFIDWDYYNISPADPSCKGLSFCLPPSMMCRQADLIPYI